MDAPGSSLPGGGDAPNATEPNLRDVCLPCNHAARREMHPNPNACTNCGQPVIDHADLLFAEAWLGRMRSKFFKRLGSGKEKNIVSVEVDNVPLGLLSHFFETGTRYGLGVRGCTGSRTDNSWDYQPEPFRFKHQSSSATEKHGFCLTRWEQLASLFAFDTLNQPHSGTECMH